MTTTDTNFSDLIINEMTKATYDTITPSSDEFYFVTDCPISSSDVTTALGYTPQAELVSGTSIKTINSTSLLGSGNISISDTKNTTGSSNSSSKLYLVGAFNQSTSAVTYSKSTVYANTDGTLNCVTPASTKNDTTVATTKWVKDLGYTTNTGTVTSVNNVSPVNGNVTLSIPSEVTETTVSGWGFTKNVGTVTKVNNVSPVNGNVTLTIPTVNNATLTITQNGTSKGTFTANASSDNTIALTDTTYSTFTGADSVTAGASGLVPAPSAGDNDKILTGGASWSSLKTVNSTPLLGSGDIDTSEIFIAVYGTTTTTQISQALSNGKTIICTKSTPSPSVDNIYYYSGTATVEGLSAFTFSRVYQNTTEVVYTSSSTNQWNTITKTLANNDLSNVSSIDSNSAVQTALDGKADTTLSNVSSIDSNSVVQTALDGKLNTSASNLSSTGQKVFDGQWVGVAATLCQGRTSETGNDKPFDVSEYVPSDSNNYEVLLTGAVTTGTTSGNQARINLISSILNDNIVICNAQTRTSSGVTTYGSCTLPIGTDREVIVQGWANNTGAYSLYLRGYRRIGTNS